MSYEKFARGWALQVQHSGVSKMPSKPQSAARIRHNIEEMIDQEETKNVFTFKELVAIIREAANEIEQKNA